jgi:hypothetical protein
VLSRRVLLAGVGAAFLAGLLVRFPDLLTAAATAVLAGFAGVQLWVEWRRRENEERTASVRLSVNAFEARKDLADWITRSQATGWWADRIVTGTQEAIEVAGGVLKILEGGLVDAAVASAASAGRMRTAYANCWRAIMQFESFLGTWHRVGGAVSPSDHTLLSDGRESLRACYVALEHVVDPALVAEAKQLGAWPVV